MDGVAIECPSSGHSVAKVSDYRFLRLKAVHDPAGIVIQRELRPRHVLGALRRLVKGFVGVAAAGHKDSGPRSGTGCIVLPSHCERGDRKKRYQIKKEALGCRISSDREDQFAASFRSAKTGLDAETRRPRSRLRVAG